MGKSPAERPHVECGIRGPRHMILLACHIDLTSEQQQLMTLCKYQNICSDCVHYTTVRNITSEFICTYSWFTKIADCELDNGVLLPGSVVEFICSPPLCSE